MDQSFSVFGHLSGSSFSSQSQGLQEWWRWIIFNTGFLSTYWHTPKVTSTQQPSLYIIILLMDKIFAPVEYGRFIPIIYRVYFHPRWLFGISEPSTACLRFNASPALSPDIWESTLRRWLSTHHRNLSACSWPSWRGFNRIAGMDFSWYSKANHFSMVGYQLDDEPNFYMGKWLEMHHFHPLRKGWNWGSRMIKYTFFWRGKLEASEVWSAEFTHQESVFLL